MRVNSVRSLCVAVCSFGLSSVFAAPVIPTAPGTTWRYNMTEEIGKGLNLPNVKADADGMIRLPVLYRLERSEDVDGKDLLKFEMHRAGTITNTDLLTIDEHGITCWARVNLDGELVKFSPPQTMIAAPLKKGAGWDFDGQAGDMKVQQHYDVVGEEKIDVPAGKFQTFRIHGEQTTPNRMTIDRWFAPGVGIVKDVTTMQDAKGDLLERISLELAEVPKIVERPEVKWNTAPKQLAVSLAKDRFGKPKTSFRLNTTEIYRKLTARCFAEGFHLISGLWT